MINEYVLYADDNEEERFLFRSSFTDLVSGISLECVSDGLELLNFLDAEAGKRGLPCLIILDQAMPFIEGDEVLELLKVNPRYKNIPVVLFSTRNFPVDKANHYKIRIEKKPSDITGWKNIVRTLLPL